MAHNFVPLSHGSPGARRFVPRPGRGLGEVVDPQEIDALVTFTGLGTADGVALDVAGGKIYWTDQSGQIERGNLDGSGSPEDLYTGLNNAHGIALDVPAGKLYWGSISSQKIQRGNLDGSGSPEDVFTGESGLLGVAVDAPNGHIYWTKSSEVRRGNLDGSGTPVTLFSDLSTSMRHLDFGPIPGPAPEVVPGVSGWALYGMVALFAAALATMVGLRRSGLIRAR